MTFEERRAARANIKVAKFRLGEEPPDDWVNTLTAEERFEMVWQLSARLSEFTGVEIRRYARAEIPIRVIPLHGK